MTIKDLANLSGYAVGTVSRVLNNQPNVSAKARARIIAIAQEAGFELNSNAKNLKQQHSNSILVLVRGVHNALYSALVEQLQKLAANSPYVLELHYIDENTDEVRRAKQLVRELKPQGILFLGGTKARFQEHFGGIQIPAVLLTNSAAGLGFPNLSSVATDDRGAAAAAIRNLTENGHRKIAIIGGDREKADTSRLRFEGCMEEFRRQGIEFDPQRYYQIERYSYAEGYAAMARILRLAPEITAVFAVSDVIAIGAARAIHDAGRQVPEDISLVGFDGLPICNYYQPRLTTMVQQTNFMAETGFRLLDDAIRHGTAARHVLAPSELSSGGSVRNIR